MVSRSSSLLFVYRLYHLRFPLTLLPGEGIVFGADNHSGMIGSYIYFFISGNRVFAD